MHAEAPTVVARSHPLAPIQGDRMPQVLRAIWGVLLVLWLAFAMLVVPALIERAYRGESLPALNAIIQGQSDNSIEYYMRRWNRITLVGLAGLVMLAISTSQTFFRRFVGEATPQTLGAIRLVTCATLLIATAWEDLGSVALLPAEMRSGGGLIGLLFALPIGFERFVANATALRALQIVTELFLFLGMIGWLTRIVIPVAALAHFVALGILIDYSFFWHQNLVPLYLLIVLSFTPCGDGLSIDRLWKIYRDRAVPQHASAVYGWSRYLCWVVIVLPYVQSGLSKVRLAGWSWWDATNMRSMLYTDSLSPREYDWHLSLSLVSAPDAVFTALGIITVLLEVSYVLVLFSRTARRILPPMTVAAHLGILLLQRILFLDLILLQFVVMDFSGIRRAISRRVAARHRQIDVLYDGSCALCRRTVRLLGTLDLFSALHFRDYRRLDLSAYNETHGLDLELADLDESMHTVARGRTFRGFAAYRQIARNVPLFWPLVPFLFLPGIQSRGDLIYARIARRRARFAVCAAGCGIEHSTEEGRLADGARAGWATRFRFALALSVIVSLAAACWLERLEFYPLTAWHLYAMRDTSGTIKYYKVMGHYDSGRVSSVRLEDGIGALALDGRYQVTVDRCFGSAADVSVCEKFLVANASAYNLKRWPGNRLTHYEIQTWKWDFVSNPRDPHHGELDNRFVVDVTTGEHSRETAPVGPRPSNN